MAELDADDRPGAGQGPDPPAHRLGGGGAPAARGRATRPRSRCSTSCSSARPVPARPPWRRIIAKIYYAFELLDSPTVVEAQRADLVGEYLGATAIKTNDLIDSAHRRGAVHRRGLQPGQRRRGPRGQVRQRGGPGAAQARRGRPGQPRRDPGRVPAADGGLPGQQPGAELAVRDAGPVRRVLAGRAGGAGADGPGAARGVAGRRGAARPHPDDGGRRPPPGRRRAGQRPVRP